MNVEIKKRWVNALRSGKYKQERGRLCIRLGHCAFGVLAEELGTEVDGYYFGITDIKYGSKAIIDINTPSNIYYIRVPDDYLSQIGITREQTNRIIAKNDKEHLDFNEIADYIEEYL